MLYINTLAAPFTVETVVEETASAPARPKTLEAMMAEEGGDCEES